MRSTSLFLVLAASLAATGCLRPVPADPGDNARLRGRAAEALPAVGRATDSAPGPAPVAAIGGAASDDGAAAIYERRCGQCHAPYSPGYATAPEWPRFVRTYAPRAGLYGAERSRVLAWLQANAR